MFSGFRLYSFSPNRSDLAKTKRIEPMGGNFTRLSSYLAQNVKARRLKGTFKPRVLEAMEAPAFITFPTRAKATLFLHCLGIGGYVKHGSPIKISVDKIRVLG